jgi:hypothetical protein
MLISRVSRLIAGRPDPDAAAGPGAASAGSRAAGPGSPVPFTLRQQRFRRFPAALAELATLLAIQLGIGALLGWMGPFGTYGALGALDRFAFWMLAIPVVGVPVSLAANAAMRAPALSGWPWPARIALAALVAALPGVFIVRALVSLFGMTLGGGFATLLGGYASVALMMAAIGIVITLARGYHRLTASPPPAEAAAAPARPAASPARPAASPFLDRIPRHLGRALRRIETEDHYLRVHTDRGHDLVLFRLADALAEIDPALGQQVHRSHWVARAAVAAVERDGPRTTLRLTDGARVPVSRSFLPALRKAGWL